MGKIIELSGIYKITNKVNGKFYIGSGQSVFSRWYNHTCDIKNGTHINYKLQSAFDKYGFSSFIFEIIELHPPYGLNTREQFYLDTLCKAQEYIRGEDTFFNQCTYNIKPLVEGTTGLPNKLESSIRSSRTRGFDRILKVHKNGGIIEVYELKSLAAEDNKLNPCTIGRSIRTGKCPKNKDFYFVYEKDYDEKFRPVSYEVHNKGQKGVQTYESQWKEVFCYDVYGRFFRKFESNTAIAKYFNVDTSSTCRMIDNPKKKILHRHGVHLYNLYSTQQEEKETIVDLFINRVNDGDIQVFTLFHEPLGEFSKETISGILKCHLQSISQTITQNKILKGFYFIRD